MSIAGFLWVNRQFVCSNFRVMNHTVKFFGLLFGSVEIIWQATSPISHSVSSQNIIPGISLYFCHIKETDIFFTGYGTVACLTFFSPSILHVRDATRFCVQNCCWWEGSMVPEFSFCQCCTLCVEKTVCNMTTSEMRVEKIRFKKKKKHSV